MVDRRPSVTAPFRAMGIDVTVRPPGGEVHSARGIWLPVRTQEIPSGGELRRAEQQHTMALLPKETLPDVPRGTIIEAAEFKGAPVSSWRVVEANRDDFDHYRATVVRVRE